MVPPTQGRVPRIAIGAAPHPERFHLRLDTPTLTSAYEAERVSASDSVDTVNRRILPLIIACGVVLAAGAGVSLLLVVAEDQGRLPQVARLWGRLFTVLVLVAVAAEVVQWLGRRRHLTSAFTHAARHSLVLYGERPVSAPDGTMVSPNPASAGAPV